MNTSYFREFIVLVETKSYWEASERLYMNQSTLSKHIKAMEQELDVPLFERSTRRVELTPYGKALLPYAQSIIREETEYSSLFLQMKNQEKGLLVIGSIPVMAQYGILNYLTTFQQKYPQNNIKILEEDPQNLFALLRNRKCELAFQRESKLDFEKNFMEDQEFIRIPIVQDYLVALFPAGHPLAKKEQVTLRELRDENFCMLKEGTLMHNLCIDACHASGFLPRISYTSHRIENLLDMICTSNHVGLLMNRHLNLLEGIRIHTDSDWAAVPVNPRIYSQISLCYLANVPLSEAAKAFVGMIR
ncbi:MAG: LysR family transcriptional regulator [Clostridiales bacterium]|nr:LysR family transcriptional regulator [Clostridiales bacterium]